MNSLKRIMIEHGEKIALAVIVLICAWSVYGMLVQEPDVLPLPGGRQKKINHQDLTKKIRSAQSHLSSNAKVMPNPEAERISLKLAKKILATQRSESKVNYEWFAYVQPSPVGVPLFIEPPEKVSFVNVPAEYRTMTGNPEDIRVISTVDKVLIICKASRFTSYVAPGSVKMIPWRKAIGSGREDLPASIRQALLSSPRTESVKSLQDKTLAESGAAAPTPAEKTVAENPALPAGFGSLFGSKTTSSDNAASDNIDASMYTLQKYKQKNLEDDRRAELDMTVVCTRDSVMKTGWERLAPQMRLLKGEPDQDTIIALLTNGYTPDTVEMSDEEKAAYEKNEASRKTGKSSAGSAQPSASNPWEGIIKKAAPEPDKAVETAKDDNADTQEDYSDRYFVFIDDNTQQNMVYRYAVISAVGLQMPPKEVLEQEQHRGWDPYVAVEGISGIPPKGGDFSQPERFVKPVFDKEMPIKSLGVLGKRFTFIPAYLTGTAAVAATPAASEADGKTQVVDTGPKVNVDALREETGGLTDLGWAYKKFEPCFSDFVYTDLVMTPKEYDLELVAAFPALNGTPAQATMRLHKVMQDGTIAETTALVSPPEQAVSVGWRDFLKKGNDGSPVWPPVDLLGKSINPVSEMPLAEAYSALGDKLLITPIKSKKRIDGKEVEFDTGWGVVEVRKIIVKGKRMRLSKDGEWEALPGGDIPPLDQYSVIIAETNPPKGQPRRFKRLYRKLPSSDKGNYRTDYQVILEPELIQKIAARMKNRGK